MNYFPFHVGDYASHTAHLEPMEDLTYRRLLDLYYLRESPLEGRPDQLARVIRLRDYAHVVEAVLHEFFEESDSGGDNPCQVWRHARCDAEIAKMQDRQAKAKASATASVNARRANAERTLNERSTDVELPTPTPTPTPEEGAKAPSRAGALCRLLREHGIQKTSPGHPLLIKLLDAGCTDAEFLAFVPSAATKSDPFAYLLAAVKGERERAAVIPLHQGRMPNKQEALEQRNAAIGQEWARKMLARGKDETG